MQQLLYTWRSAVDIYVSHFRVLLFHFTFSAFLPFSFLGAGLGKRTEKPLGAHQQRIFDRINEREYGCFVIYIRILCFLYWKFDIIRSLYINCIVSSFTSLLLFVSFFLCSTRQKEFSRNMSTNFLLAKRRNSKMEDRLHVHKFVRNNDQTTASTWFERCTRTPKIEQR